MWLFTTKVFMMKFLKKIKKSEETQDLNISADDIDLLAALCEKCLPIVKKNFLSRKTYSYYVPADETNISVVRGVFMKYGLVTDSAVSDGVGYVFIEHKNKAHAVVVADLMRDIRHRKQQLVLDFYNKRDNAIWWKVQERLNEMKYNEKQIQK